MTYNWQLPDWPDFKYDTSTIESLLFNFAERAGRIGGLVEGLSNDSREEAVLEIMLLEALKTSEIEGEYMTRLDVMSSIRRNLGFADHHLTKDKRAQGIAELMIAARSHYHKPLSDNMLFTWHQMLMMGNNRVNAGKWRRHSEPMQVISGAVGREKIHFEAPPSKEVPEQMAQFINWFNVTGPGGSAEISQAPVRSAIAHLYFESIHPFEDGNGRIGRAISEKALSQGIGQPAMISLSKTIEADRGAYYKALKNAQSSNHISSWIQYFVKVVVDAQLEAEELIRFTLKKARLFDEYKDNLNDRQLKVLKKMLGEGHAGFKGGMNARKYMSIVKTTKATATRDLQDLVQKGVFATFGGGRSTQYEVII